MTFTDTGLPDPLVNALAKLGITVPTDIQRAAIGPLREGQSTYVQSETGSGKTLAYLLPLFCRVDAALAATQAVILAPTHELAIQIQRVACDLAQHAGVPMRALLLIGGTAIDRQIDKLKKKPQLVVGSPGRVLELIQKGKLKMNAVKAVVLDESDRLLFAESLAPVRKIIQLAPPARQLVFVSATRQAQAAAEAASLAPGLVNLQTAPAPVNANIEHLCVLCDERDKADTLRRLLHALNPERAMVFVHRNDSAELLKSKLDHYRIPSSDLHGAYHKEDRKRAMEDFRAGKVRVLIVSDLGARGLDIPGVTHIFNLDAPSDSAAYLHRVGRTARAGARGVAVSILAGAEARLAERYEKDLGITVRVREGRIDAV